MLKKATEGIQQTRKEIVMSIAQSQNTINSYNKIMEEHKQKLEKQVDEKLKIHYKLEKEEPARESEKCQRVQRTMKSVEKYLKKKDMKIEYKYAFGQRIPVDYEWKVKQPSMSDKDKKFLEGKD